MTISGTNTIVQWSLGGVDEATRGEIQWSHDFSDPNATTHSISSNESKNPSDFDRDFEF